jgi:hypothetical protein
MTAGRNPSELSLSEWSLEPLADAEAPARTSDPQPGPTRFHAESRSDTDRRKGGDRRESLRFETDRRTGKDRRPRKGWEPGSNL